MAECSVCGTNVNPIEAEKRSILESKRTGQPAMVQRFFLCSEHQSANYEVHPLADGSCLVLDKRTGVVTSCEPRES